MNLVHVEYIHLANDPSNDALVDQHPDLLRTSVVLVLLQTTQLVKRARCAQVGQKGLLRFLSLFFK